MAVYSEIIRLKTAPEKIYDLTQEIEEAVRHSDVTVGLCTISCPGSSAALTINENDPMMFEDLKKALSKLAPKEALYHDPEKAQAYIRASILGSEKCIPVIEGKLAIEEDQHIFFMEFDKEKKERKVFVVVSGDQPVD
jgi:secondary thiamine-phosphate synthase enzyme